MCSDCKHYQWYINWCDKWQCEVYWKSVHSCFEEDKCGEDENGGKINVK